MAATMPVVIVCGIATVLLVRSHDVRAWQATVIAVFGAYLAMSPIGWTIFSLTNWFVNALTS